MRGVRIAIKGLGKPWRSAKCRPGSLRRLKTAQRRCESTLEEVDERVLMRSDLEQNDVIVSGFHVAIDRLEMSLR